MACLLRHKMQTILWPPSDNFAISLQTSLSDVPRSRKPVSPSSRQSIGRQCRPRNLCDMLETPSVTATKHSDKTQTYHVGTPHMSAQNGHGTAVLEAPNTTIPILRCRCEHAIIGTHVNIIDDPCVTAKGAHQDRPASVRQRGTDGRVSTAVRIGLTRLELVRPSQGEHADQIIIGARNEVPAGLVKA